MPRSIFALAGLFLAIGAAWAQLRVDVRLVNVVATVTDDNGRYVEGLEAADFTLAEDGVRQQITHFSASHDLPVSVGIVLDSSGSMERKMSTAVRAVDRFLRSIHEDDDIFLMSFADSVKVRQDFTSNRDKLWDALEKVKPSGGTSLYDAVIEATDKIRKGKHPKKAILLISDGVDTSSEHDYNVTRLAVRESEVLVYALGIAPDTATRGPMSERNPPIFGPGTPGRTPSSHTHSWRWSANVPNSLAWPRTSSVSDRKPEFEFGRHRHESARYIRGGQRRKSMAHHP